MPVRAIEVLARARDPVRMWRHHVHTSTASRTVCVEQVAFLKGYALRPSMRVKIMSLDATETPPASSCPGGKPHSSRGRACYHH